MRGFQTFTMQWWWEFLKYIFPYIISSIFIFQKKISSILVIVTVDFYFFWKLTFEFGIFYFYLMKQKCCNSIRHNSLSLSIRISNYFIMNLFNHQFFILATFIIEVHITGWSAFSIFTLLGNIFYRKKLF